MHATVGDVSITEDAPVAARRSPVRLPGRARMDSPWRWLVAGSAAVLLGAALGLAAWWAATRETRITTYRVLGTLSAIELQLEDANVEVVGAGGGAVDVRRTDALAFGRRPAERRAVEGGVLRIGSRCPEIAVGSCHSDYRIAVPDNVQVTLRTTTGRVRVSRLNASARIETITGSIAVEGFCGFTLVATTEGGSVSARTDCSPDRVELRSGSGSVHAVVPAGRYRVDAESAGGTAQVRGLIDADDASFQVQAISGGADVLVEGRR
jgi:hypothetical protein